MFNNSSWYVTQNSSPTICNHRQFMSNHSCPDFLKTISASPKNYKLTLKDCSITSLTKVCKWGSQYNLNRNLGPYFHLGQGMLSQNPSPLTLLSSLLSPFLSRSPSPSGQSVEIIAVAEDDPKNRRGSSC